MSPRYSVEASCYNGHYQDRIVVDLSFALRLMNLTDADITPADLPSFVNTELSLRHRCLRCGQPLRLDNPRLGIYRVDIFPDVIDVVAKDPPGHSWFDFFKPRFLRKH